MLMKPTTVRWTETEQLSLDLPEHWQVLGHYTPRVTAPIEDLSAQLADRLHKPLGRQALSKLLSKARKVTLVVDDLTRTTPVAQLLAPVAAALEKSGIPDDQVTGVVATGMHPSLSKEQLISKLGPEFTQRFKWVQNDYRQLAGYAHLGRTDLKAFADAGINGDLDVYLLKELEQADLIIMFSSVSPHLQAGFGGGSKLILPGCAHVATIGPLHKIGLNEDIAELVGQQATENRMRQGSEGS